MPKLLFIYLIKDEKLKIKEGEKLDLLTYLLNQFLITATQATSAAMDAGEEKPYDCGSCHTTGYNPVGHQDGLEGIEGVAPNDAVVPRSAPREILLDESILGRVVDGLGRPIDDKGPLRGTERRSLDQTSLPPLSRTKITEPLAFGVRAIDGLLTTGKGQQPNQPRTLGTIISQSRHPRQPRLPTGTPKTCALHG